MAIKDGEIDIISIPGYKDTIISPRSSELK